MYEIAEQVKSWLDDGRDVTVAQVVSTRGFSSREPGAAAAWASGERPVGSVLAALDAGRLSGRSPGLAEIAISDDDAVAAGLACGGAASVLVQSAAAYPAEVWTQLAARAPVCLVTQVNDGRAGRTRLFTPQSIRDAGSFGNDIPRLFGRGVSATALMGDGPAMTAVVSLWPVPTLVVVGDGLIAQALVDTAALLGWQARVTPGVDDAVSAAETLHRSDAFVVLSHDREVDGPALTAALNGRVGYVGGLGSRRTQDQRRTWLTERGVSADDQARIHGPAGLDIDAHTPVEIAISIVAEILGSRASSSGGALRDRGGPVHGAGVQAPPPRY